MGALTRAKTVAEIAELLARIYGLLVDKSRAKRQRDQEIKELKAQLAELKQKLARRGTTGGEA